MNSTLEVENLKDGALIRISNKFEMERAIMKDYSTRFTLACSSPLLQKTLIYKMGLFAEKVSGQQIISQVAVQF